MGTVLGSLSKRIEYRNAINSMRNATADLAGPKEMSPSSFGRLRKYLNRHNEPCCDECAKKAAAFKNCCGQ